ncbi:hypothetical protein PRIC2_002319 [Phytophthora ramorum]|uniref:PA-phosphatase related-family protein n=1 Tax=Phytophthora ramorum TaxID=164328 RepID=UPI0030AB7D37|nr:PA-phosphatase related-family protein [Phytophthora ramorum]
MGGDGFRLEDDSYQTVCTPPQDSDVVTDSSENTRVDSNLKKWQRLLREFRVVEYAFAIVLYIIARKLGKWMKIHERAFPRIETRLNSTTSIWGRDPAMDEEKLSEQVPMHMLIIVSLAIAITTNLFMNYVCPMLFKVRVIAHDFRDFLLSLGQAITLSTFLVNFMKNMAGRFRPCFFAMCDWNHDVVWDGVTNLCSDPDGDDEGRKSFPSGHSSFAWSVMGVLTLYLLGRARLTSAEQSGSIVQEGVRTFKLFFCFLPCLAAAWVAITRSTDNRHHFSDIVAGSAIGAAAACLAYNHNYGSIYAWEFAGLPWATIHQRRKAKLEDAAQSSHVEEGNNATNLPEHFIGAGNRASSSK